MADQKVCIAKGTRHIGLSSKSVPGGFVNWGCEAFGLGLAEGRCVSILLGVMLFSVRGVVVSDRGGMRLRCDHQVCGVVS